MFRVSKSWRFACCAAGDNAVRALINLPFNKIIESRPVNSPSCVKGVISAVRDPVNIVSSLYIFGVNPLFSLKTLLHPIDLKGFMQEKGFR